MPRRLALLAAGFLFAAAPPVGAQAAAPLVQVVSGSDGSTISIDPSSVTRSGDSSFVLTTVVRFSAAVGEQHKADRELDTDELDCARQRSRAIAWALYRADTLVSADAPEGGWQAVEADWAPMAQAMCAMLLRAFASTLPVEHEATAVTEAPLLANAGAIRREIARRTPRYLPEAMWPGRTLVRVRVDPDGIVRAANIRVLWSTQPEFVAPAIQVVQRMRFRPATLNGARVAVWATLPVTFHSVDPFALRPPWDGTPGRLSRAANGSGRVRVWHARAHPGAAAG